MPDLELDVPVVLIIFKRPDTTRQVLEALARAQLARLFVVGDGPRLDHPEDAAQVAAARALIEGIDWECEVRTNYADANLGLRKRVASGLDWVFEQVERAIILEDDCVPEPTFFPFCQELLERYQDDERIMVISGDNFLRGRVRNPYSYHYSRYNHCWGWATWRRAWLYYDDKMTRWPEVREGGWLMDILDGDRRDVKYWTKIFDQVYAGRVDSWAYRWTFACWTQSGLTVLPNVNLVSNIGFGSVATHTVHHSSSSNLPTQALEFPLRHPAFVIRDTRADRFTQKNRYGTGWIKTFKRTAARVLRFFGLIR
ncbi:MAG: hypothetical protein JXA78_08620 [Anaerolineales bacterium]|nr:hypothetical protein [Anaerolineales bacterium]